MRKKSIFASLFASAALVAALSSCSKTPEPQPAANALPAETAPLPDATASAPPPPVRESAWKAAPPPAPKTKSHRAPANPATEAPAAAQSAPPPAAQSAPPASQTVAAAPPPAAQPESRYTPPPPPPPEPMKVTLQSGSLLPVRIGESLTSDKNAAGDSFTATLAEPLVINGYVIAERGSRAEGRVVQATKAGRVKGVAELELELTSFQTADGQRVRVSTEHFAQKGKDGTKGDVAKVGIASGIGAAIGAIAGGGKGAAIGAGVGAGAGTGGVLLQRGKPAQIPAETIVRFRVSEPVTITEKLK